MPTFKPGELVITPKGKGTVVHRFPSWQAKREVYTVRLPLRANALPFYARELKRAGDPGRVGSTNRG